MQQRFTYYSRVFGCQMNVADNDAIGARLSAQGGVAVDSPDDADLILVNTCTVRQKAEEKAMSFFGGLKRLSSPVGAAVSAPAGATLAPPAVRAGLSLSADALPGRFPAPDAPRGVPVSILKIGSHRSSAKKPFIVAMGCAVPKARQKIAATFPHVDLLVNYSDPDLVLAELAEHFPPLIGQATDDGYTPLLDAERALPSFVTAIRGCNHRCSFCVVPWARGPQRDVPLQQIVAEARQYEAAGAPDITILGQSIMAYGKSSPQPHPNFVELMEALLAETSFRWVTFLTSLACDFTPDVASRVIANPRITPLLHLPVQSGSDKVLGEMLRRYDRATYMDCLRQARAARPDLYLTTDILVGFPTETEADFAETLSLIDEAGFDDAFMFAYSPRPGTHSARVYPDRIPRAEKMRRLSLVIERMRAQSAGRNKRYLGQVLEVIIEQRREDGGVTARTAFNKPVHLDSAQTPIGQFARVRITGTRVTGFTGEELGSA